MKRNTSDSLLRTRRRSRRGSVYLLVLMVGMIITVIGVSGAALSRNKLRLAETATQAGEARLLAATAAEHALATIESTPAWKTLYVGKDLPAPVSYSSGTFRWRITDAGGGTFKVTGTGTKGSTRRILSTRYTEPIPSAALDKAIYATGNIVVTTTTTHVNGPIATGGVYTNNGITNGNVEAASLVNSGTLNGTFTAKAPVALPPSSIFDTYKARATDINYLFTFGTISNQVLSSASNSYGSQNANGIYSIEVPAFSTLNIENSRIVGTLVVTLNAGATLNVGRSILWEKGAGNFPILLIKATGAGTINLTSHSSLKESSAGANLNPFGTPYLGGFDFDFEDTYPVEFQGLIHVFGADAVTNLGAFFNLKGALITEGSLNTGGDATVTFDKTLKTNPPAGYEGTRRVNNWQWEVLP